jgi:hypothetical protein
VVTPTPAWLLSDTSVADKITVTLNRPDNTWNGMYKIQIVVCDDFSPTIALGRKYNIGLTINANLAPTMTTPIINTLSTTIPWPFNHTFTKTSFTDAEGDNIYIDCTSITPSVGGSPTAWITTSYVLATGIESLSG